MRKLLGLALLLVAGCYGRAPCQRDTGCAPSEVCYFDGACLPRDVARRAGAPVGDACGPDRPPCRAPGFCQAGFCMGEPPKPAPFVTPDAAPGPDGALDTTAPEFQGLVEATPDGDGALLVYWPAPLDDGDVEILIYRAERPGAQDLAAPIAVVKQQRSYHDAGLIPGREYFYLARARDAAGNSDANLREVSATARNRAPHPAGVDFASEVLPIFRRRCVICHGGASSLYLDGYDAVLAGGAHGQVVVPCAPRASTLAGKIGPEPPFGARMPKSGPPYLSLDEMALIQQWIAEGAEPIHRSEACPQAGPPRLH